MLDQVQKRSEAQKENTDPNESQIAFGS